MKKVFVVYPDREGMFSGMPPFDYLDENVAITFHGAEIVSSARAEEHLDALVTIHSQLAKSAMEGTLADVVDSDAFEDGTIPVYADVVLLGWLSIAIARTEMWLASDAQKEKSDE